ncbi:hypothetical protein ACFPFX_29185 [Streptomyces mauvecolor]|uniref:Uncharacterized protein n=1 Tax=Streptomyces mauvecolor TaxID=58345 RepID=A0ABV9UW48_9ACTN
MRTTPLRGQDVAWLKCPTCRLKCRPTAVVADGPYPRCGSMLKLAFVGRPKPQPPTAEEREDGR